MSDRKIPSASKAPPDNRPDGRPSLRNAEAEAVRKRREAAGNPTYRPRDDYVGGPKRR